MRKAIILCVILTLFVIFKTDAMATTTYTIESGDTLSGISKKFYNNAAKYTVIFEANKDVIKNPNLIYPGMVIQIPDLEDSKDEPKSIISRSKLYPEMKKQTFKTTAYDLSIASCGKAPGHPAYGITYSGKSIAGKTREEAMACAVDPKVIPLGSLIMITFEDEYYQKYNGVYQALDTGGAVKGKHIDLFLGDFNSKKESDEVRKFGVTKSTVTILRRGW